MDGKLSFGMVSNSGPLKCPYSMNTTQTLQMNRIEINRSILNINNQKEVLQRQIDHLNQHIQFLAAQREQLQFDETPLFDQMFGG